MGIVQRVHHWHESRHIFFNLALRIVVGLLLMLKGIYFVSNSQHLEAMVRDTSQAWAVNFMVSYITFAHMFGGAFIILGLLTRAAVVLQLPIIIGALYYNLAPTAFGTGAELFLSIVVLVLLVYLLVNGSGRVSMDDYLKKHLL
jgi:putative oxidoreductase